MSKSFFDEKVATTDEIFSGKIGTLGFVAGAFDYFGLQEVIERNLSKEGPNVKIDFYPMIKAMSMQLLNMPWQTLYGTEAFYEHLPYEGLLGVEGMDSHDLNRVNLARCLDAIYEAGSQRLFIECAQAVVRKLGLKVECAHIDTTSMHYDGEGYKEEGCEVELLPGYSRDHHPELNQIVSLMLCDNDSRLPLFQKSLSGNVSDKTSFFEFVKGDWGMLRQTFSELEYLVGDSALCTEKIFTEAQSSGIQIISRIPDSNNLSQRCFEQGKAGKFEDIDPDHPDGQLGMWCEDGRIGGVPVKLLLVNNENMRMQKAKTINRHALKEQQTVAAKLKKLETSPCKCRADAEKSVATLQKALKYCTISEVEYEEVQKHAGRGRPKADAELITVGVKVTGKVGLNQEAIEERIEQAVRFVICTTDTRRKWTMKDLLGLYRKQSVIERSWRFMKCRKLMIDTLYLKKPSRITALMWLMTLTLLIYAASEYAVRKAMKEHGLTLPTPDHRGEQAQPTMMRLLTYIGNLNIAVVRCGGIFVTGLSRELINILNALGRTWANYYLPSTYEYLNERIL